MKVLLLFALFAAATAGNIDPALQARLDKGEVVDVMVEFPSLEDIFDSVISIQSRTERRTKMVQMLKERTEKSRKPFVKILTELGLHNVQRGITEPIWISNRFPIQNCDSALASVLARIPEKFTIREEKTVSIFPAVTKDVVKPEQDDLQWGVRIIQAHETWSRVNGSGIVVGIIDTGVHMIHESIRDSYAGTGASGWYDPYYNRPEPNDIQSHGTHCIGSVLGRTNGIGVAPGATWVAARGLNDAGSGSEQNLLLSAQFMLAESDPLPHIITNSWGGGSNDPWYNEAMRAWIVNGQIPVFALGNSGSRCSSNNSPGDSLYALGVGATTINDAVASFSSRGPTRTFLKPEVSAPGENVISAGNTGTNSYTSKSGTSMATPHVAGAVALLMQQDPNRNFYDIKRILQETGDQPPVSPNDVNCVPGGPEWPNAAFGHGRINCLKAVNHEENGAVGYF